MTRFAIPAVPIVAACALAMPAAAAEVQIAATGPVVELTVNASVEAEPDIATMAAGVSTRAQTAVEAMRQNAVEMNAVVARIKELGVASRDIQTTGINLSADYEYDQTTRRQVFRGYEASNRVSVKLRDISRIGEVLDALVEAGANNLSGPNWSVDDDTRAKAQARRNALETAQSQAREYAQSAGYKDVRLLEISESVSSRTPAPMLRSVAFAVDAQAAPVEPGMVEAGVTISVKYEMTR